MQGVGHDISKVCKMSKASVQGNLMGFAPKPKPIHFVASLAHSGLGSWGVMGLGQNVLKVLGGLDVAISLPPPPPHPFPK
jgi:hypothetical protein